MKIGHFLNVLAVHSELIQEYVEDSGSRGFIARFYESLEGVPLDTGKVSEIIKAKMLVGAWK